MVVTGFFVLWNLPHEVKHAPMLCCCVYSLCAPAGIRQDTQAVIGQFEWKWNVGTQAHFVPKPYRISRI